MNVAINTILANPANADNIREVHFSLYNLMILKAYLGHGSGLPEKIFNMPLNVKTIDERRKEKEEALERIRRALLMHSTELGYRILDVMEQIDEKIAQLEDMLDRAREASPPDAEQIEQLEDDIQAYQEQREALERVDDLRMNAANEEEMREAERGFDIFMTTFGTFMELMRKRDRPTDFRASSDGIEITDPPRTSPTFTPISSTNHTAPTGPSSSASTSATSSSGSSNSGSTTSSSSDAEDEEDHTKKPHSPN